MLAGSLASETATSRSNERAPGNALEAGQLCLTEMEDWAPDRRKRRDGTGPRLSLRVEIAIQSELWKQHAHIGTLVRKALRTASATVSLEGGEVSVILAGDSAVRVLNRRWRKRDRPTNVLSFPAHRWNAGALPPLLGDIVIAYETTRREADAQQKPFAHHVTHLVVHGFLHLLGYDHAGAEEARAMERIEASILARLEVPDPYTRISTAIS
jgi:probable rRNA maturation factor